MPTYSLPNVKPWAVSAAQEIGTKFGLKTIGGWRASDPYPDHPSGLALDLMTNNIGAPTVRNPTGTAISDYLIANASRLGVDYIIWNGKSWNSRRKTWANYTGSNPHTDHVHVTFNKTAPTGGGAVVDVPGGSTPLSNPFGGGDLLTPLSGIADSAKGIAGAFNTVGELFKKMMWLSLPTTWTRIVSGVLGIGFLFVGVAFLVREVRRG